MSFFSLPQIASGPTVEMATDMKAWRSVMEKTLVIRRANPIFLGMFAASIQSTYLWALSCYYEPTFHRGPLCQDYTMQFLLQV